MYIHCYRSVGRWSGLLELGAAEISAAGGEGCPGGRKRASGRYRFETGSGTGLKALLDGGTFPFGEVSDFANEPAILTSRRVSGEGLTLVDGRWRSTAGVKRNAVAFFWAVAVGTVVAFLISLPLVKSAGKLFDPYLKSHLPPLALAQAVVVLLALASLLFFRGLPWKIWRSVQFGLIPVRGWMFGLPLIAAFWILLGLQHFFLALGSLALSALLTIAVDIPRRDPAKADPSVSRFLESDLPVSEDGEDLLGRGELIKSLVSTIVLEQPAVIAITGAYGKGKTSFLNLAMGELKRQKGSDLP